ncbi:unnamed protein product [Schistosoma mattheei]|uniref:Uncharacterized protein n=1 Tax=Schistosoma mattheei TaxID=31246 RepID=A0A3P7XIK7_9TREM|nr:unnamed protein product [Schistosoma mattheei]
MIGKSLSLKLITKSHSQSLILKDKSFNDDKNISSRLCPPHIGENRVDVR